MRYMMSIALSAARTTQLFEERANEFFRGNPAMAPLAESLQSHPGLRAVIPEEILQRAGDPLCWTLEFFGRSTSIAPDFPNPLLRT